MDILINEFQEGWIGNEVFVVVLKKVKYVGLKFQIYIYFIGYYGYGVGLIIGFWDQQEGVFYKGDYLFYYNIVYFIELNIKVFLLEWNKEICMMMEEDVFFDENGVCYIDGWQEELYLIFWQIRE